MSTSRVPSLPLETIESIVDFLYEDRKTLIACSLASSKFLAASRYHLFVEVTLATYQLERFVELVDAPWCSFANRIGRVVVIGASSSSSSSSAGCKNSNGTLKMRMARRKAMRAAAAAAEKKMMPTPADLSRIESRLRSVKHLRFAELTPLDISEPFWAILGTMRSVRGVDAYRFGLQCPLPFLEFVSSLPCLERLGISRPTVAMPANRLSSVQQLLLCESQSIGGNGDGDGGSKNRLLPQREEGPGGVTRPRTLELPVLDLRRTSAFLPPLPGFLQQRELDTCTVAGIAVLQWLVAQRPRVPRVRTMRINVDADPAMNGLLSDYFGLAGSSVENLCVVVPSSLAVLENMPPIDFTPLTHVQHLHIEGLYISHTANEHLLAPFLRQFFAQLFLSPSDAMTPPATPRISKITITLTLDAKSELSFFGMPDHAVLQDFGWFALPQLIARAFASASSSSSSDAQSKRHDALENLRVHLRVRSTGIVGGAREEGYCERMLREGDVWRAFADRGRLEVGFLPMMDREGEGFESDHHLP